LCYEVEGSLNNTFEKIGFVVSQLYGSSQVSQIDRFIIEESNIFVATPEKAKVILRANDDIRNQIKLVIIDEGHLLDTDEKAGS
jgi:replicative superfamily II helicase